MIKNERNLLKSLNSLLFKEINYFYYLPKYEISFSLVSKNFMKILYLIIYIAIDCEILFTNNY